MRPGGTQTKRGAAVRMRRRLGLAPRAYALLSCSLVLVIAGVSAYGMTVPSMMQAHAAREPCVGHEVKSDLGTTTGYAWASVVAHIVFGTDDADGAEAPGQRSHACQWQNHRAHQHQDHRSVVQQ